MHRFSEKTCEELRYYVYLLVDPRDNKVFYVGKGINNRVFNHVECSIETETQTDKLDTIRDIRDAGLAVKHYIVRHGLDEDDAFTVESVLIDLFTYPDFESIAHMSNIVAGHHQFDLGIKTVEEIETLYACEPLKLEDIRHNIMTININNTYRGLKNAKEADPTYSNIYEATRKHWKLSLARAEKVEYVLSEYRGVVRAIFKPLKWSAYRDRFYFDGEEITPETNKEITDLYLNKMVPSKKKGMANPIHYFEKFVHGNTTHEPMNAVPYKPVNFTSTAPIEHQSKTTRKRDYSFYSFNGQSHLNKGQLMHAIVRKYLEDNPKASFEEFSACFAGEKNFYIESCFMPFEEAKVRKNSRGVLDIRHFIKDGEEFRFGDKVLAVKKGYDIETMNKIIHVATTIMHYTVELSE